MTDDLLTSNARALALRGKLIAAGFDPLTVVWDAERERYVIELPIEQDSWPFIDWLNAEGLLITDRWVTAKTSTIKLEEQS